MRPSKINDDDALVALRDVFREHGFDGASLTRLSDATGLQRASLYYRFPNGKDGMAEAVIDGVSDQLDREVFAALADEANWRKRLQVMCEQLNAYYNGGQTPCLLAAFSFGSVPEPVRRKARGLITRWREFLAALAVDAGQSQNASKLIAEQILAEIQGGLILASLLDDAAPFQRVLERLPNLVSESQQAPDR